jgi:protocatechuate 3,4-dioxygenase beta subunit
MVSENATSSGNTIGVFQLGSATGSVTAIPQNSYTISLSFTKNSGSSYPNPTPSTVNVQGNYSVPELAAGGWTVTATSQDSNAITLAQGTVTFTAVAGQSVVIPNISLSPTFTHTGTISGIPDTATSLNFFASGADNSSVSASTNFQAGSNSASYTLSGLKTQSYSISITSSRSSGNNSIDLATYSTTASVTSDLSGQNYSLVLLPQNTLNGRVVNSQGIAISGAQVSIFSFGSQNCGNHFSGIVTDSNGLFSAPNITCDSVRVSVSGLISGNSADTSFNYSLNNSVSLSGVVTRDIVVPLGSGSISGAVKNASNNNIISGVQVTLYPLSYNPEGSLSMGSTSMNATGSYEFSSVPLGMYTINTNPLSGFSGFSRSIELTASQPSKARDLLMRATPAGSRSLAVTVRDSATSQPIEGAWINLWSVGSGTSFSGNQIPQTDVNGNYTFSNLPEGNYYLSVSAYINGVNYKYVHEAVSVSASDVSRTINLLKYPTGSTTLSGQITDSNGNGLSNVSVNLQSEDAGHKHAQTDSSGNYTISNVAPGSYSFHVSSQDFSLYEWTQRDDLTVTAGQSTITRNEVMRIVEAGTGVIRGKLRDSKNHTSISGASLTLMREAGGFQQILATTASDGTFSFTGLPDGRYYILAVADGYVVEKEPELMFGGGYGGSAGGESAAQVDLAAGEQANVTIKMLKTLPGRGTLQGTISVNGAPMADVWIYVTSSLTGNFLGYVMTDDNGVYTLPNVPAGGIEVHASPQSSEYAQMRSTASVSASMTTVVDFESSLAGRITGIAVDADGNPPQCIWAIAFRANQDGSVGSFASSSQVSAGTAGSPGTGAYTIDSLAPGDYFVNYVQVPYCQGNSSFTSSNFGDTFFSSSTSAGSLSAPTRVTVTSGVVTTGVNVTLLPGARLTGFVKVETPSGATLIPAGKAIQVRVYREKAGNFVRQPQFDFWVTSRDAGSFDIQGLAPGSYKLEFRDTWEGNRGYERTFYGGSSTLADATTINLTRGTTLSGITIVMPVKTPVQDPEAVETSELDSATQEQIDAPASVSANQQVTIDVGEDLAGEWVSVWAHSTPTLMGDWVQVKADGTVSATIPSSLPQGQHKIVVQDVDNAVVGWSGTTVAASSTGIIAKKVTSRSGSVSVSTEAADDLSGTPIQGSKNKKDSGASSEDTASDVANLQSAELWWMLGFIPLAVALFAGGFLIRKSRRN